jgi:hypothetical protein
VPDNLHLVIEANENPKGDDPRSRPKVEPGTGILACHALHAFEEVRAMNEKSTEMACGGNE